MADAGKRIEERFFRREMSDYYIYKALSRLEGKPKLKELLHRLELTEKGHMLSWQRFAGRQDVDTSKEPLPVRMRVFWFTAARRLLGIAFTTRLLEMNEVVGIHEYEMAVHGQKMSGRERRYLRAVINDENGHERRFAQEVEGYEGSLEYIGSIVFGLNDGLVEILAAVAGLAVIASSGLVVVAGGIIVGISGTLSMAGGAYLSSKSHGLVTEAIDRSHDHHDTSPAKDALFTGVYYFLGAAVPIAPFALGLDGYAGITAAIMLVMLVLAIASAIIAVVSGTSIRRRTFEMIAISLGAAFATIVLGLILRAYFGVVI